ncbi:MAG: hypothetical protein CMN30_12930 [Sandaracinus sp.]|nr:hypothetical protein [Sandaracinus sp.]
MRWVGMVVLALALWGCGDDDAEPMDAGVETMDDGIETPDAADPSGDAGPAEGGLLVAATRGELTLPFGLAIRGTGTRRFGEITVDDAIGTVTYRGTEERLVVYERTDWPEANQTLFQALMPRDQGWVVLWFYCQEGALTGVYSESTDGDLLVWNPGTGTCVDTDGETTTPVELDEVRLPDPLLYEGTIITGPNVELGGATPGWVELGAQRFVVHPFEHVDCSECAMGGWNELHAMLVDEATGRACFGIFYLYLDDPTRVDLTYSLSLPDLSDPAGHSMLAATWTDE